VTPYRAVLLAAAIAMCGCGSAPPPAVIVDYTYEVVHAYPHDRDAFTQGLFYQDGVLYEGTGLYEHSSIRRVKLETGEVLAKRDLPGQFFGEGIAPWQDRIVQLTYQNEKGFLYDLNTFEPRGDFSYPGEGWGLTCDGKRLIMSDGSSRLRILDPQNMQELSRVLITDDGGPVPSLNELEWVKGEVFANIWKVDRIARINLETGKVTGWIDMRGLITNEERGSDPDNVLNGIAYDAQKDRLFVTGKHWPKLFEIRLIARPSSK